MHRSILLLAIISLGFASNNLSAAQYKTNYRRLAQKQRPQQRLLSRKNATPAIRKTPASAARRSAVRGASVDRGAPSRGMSSRRASTSGASFRQQPTRRSAGISKPIRQPAQLVSSPVIPSVVKEQPLSDVNSELSQIDRQINDEIDFLNRAEEKNLNISSFILLLIDTRDTRDVKKLKQNVGYIQEGLSSSSSTSGLDVARIKNVLNLIDKKIDLLSKEYERYMKLIESIDKEAYELLRKCESVSSRSCLEIGENTLLYNPDKTGGQYPFIVIGLSLQKDPPVVQKILLKNLLSRYKESMPITADERKQIMEVINSIAPELYQELMVVDPQGEAHISRYYDDPINATVSINQQDGLPYIRIGSEVIKWPIGEQRAIIGHELGHYVLGHEQARVQHTLSHAILTHLGPGAKKEFIKGKMVKDQLQPEETFGHAFTRTQEFEADRFAVLNLQNITIDDAIAQRQHVQYRDYGTKVFKSTHPLSQARVNQFNELRREVELRKGRKPTPIDWKQLAKDYVKVAKKF